MWNVGWGFCKNVVKPLKPKQSGESRRQYRKRINGGWEKD